MAVVQLELFPKLYRDITKSGKERAIMEWYDKKFIFDNSGDYCSNPDELAKGDRVLRRLTYWDIRDELGIYMNCVTGIPFAELEKAIYGLPYRRYVMEKEKSDYKNDCFDIFHIFGDRPFLPTHYLIGTSQKRPIEIADQGDVWYYRNPQGIGRKFSKKHMPMDGFTEVIS